MTENQMQKESNNIKYRVVADFNITMSSDFQISEKDLSEYFKNDYEGYNDCEFSELDRYSKETIVEHYLEFNDLCKWSEWSPEDHYLRSVNELF
jgi:hypothetical protein